MGLSIDHVPGRLPRRFPIGATYVVEGYNGPGGRLRVTARYVVLPDGCRINVPADLGGPKLARVIAFRRRARLKRSRPDNPPPKVGNKSASRRKTA